MPSIPPSPSAYDSYYASTMPMLAGPYSADYDPSYPQSKRRRYEDYSLSVPYLPPSPSNYYPTAFDPRYSVDRLDPASARVDPRFISPPRDFAYQMGSRYESRYPPSASSNMSAFETRLLLPDKLIGFIIGKHGDTLRCIRESTYCDLTIPSNDRTLKCEYRVVRAKAPYVEQVADCINEIMKLMEVS